MIGGTLRWQGLRELQQALGALPDAVAANALVSAVHAGGEVVRYAALGNIHSKTGRLARGLKNLVMESTRDRAKVVVEDTAPHATIVEFGHVIVRGGKKGKGGEIIGQVPPHPFLRKAFDENQENALEHMAEVLGRNIDAAWQLVPLSAGYE